MIKKYLIFDLDGTLIESMKDTIQTILEYLEKQGIANIDKANYVFQTTPGMALKSQLEIIFKGIDNINIDDTKNDVYNLLNKNNNNFFKGVPEKIIELSKTYQLFLTTGNSTKLAKKHLTNGGILNCFELIYGSDKILKGMEHLNIFKNYSNDEHFFEKSIYIGDGNMDREFSKEAGIDFIHIGNTKKDKYEIDSVKNINIILNKINKG